MVTDHSIVADLNRCGVTPCIDVMQDDKYSRNVIFLLYQDNTAFTQLVGASAVIHYSKADGTGGTYNEMPNGEKAYSITGNSVLVKLAPQVCTVPGLVKLSVALISGESVLHTFVVHINVHPTPGINVKSEDYENVTAGSAGSMVIGLDISEWVSIDFSDRDGKKYYLTDYVDSAELLKQMNAGYMFRVKVMGIDNTPHTIILDALHSIPVGDGVKTICSGTTSNIYHDAYSNYSLNIEVGNDGTYTTWFSAYPRLSGESAEQPEIVSIAVTEAADRTVTMVNTLEGGETETIVISADADGNPNKLTYNGKEIPIAWSEVT